MTVTSPQDLLRLAVGDIAYTKKTGIASTAYEQALTPERVAALCEAAGLAKFILQRFSEHGDVYAAVREVTEKAKCFDSNLIAAFAQENPEDG